LSQQKCANTLTNLIYFFHRNSKENLFKFEKIKDKKAKELIEEN
jgi:hypothetical protein